MNKVTKIAGIMALASITSVAIAGGYSCGSKAQQHQHKSHHCHMMKGDYKGEKMHHGKSCAGKFGSHKNMTPEKRAALMQLKVENKLEHMTRHLNLTAEQQTEIRSIMQDIQQKKLALKKQKREQINKVLTEEQKELRNNYRQNHKKS